MRNGVANPVDVRRPAVRERPLHAPVNPHTNPQDFVIMLPFNMREGFCRRFAGHYLFRTKCT
eukprot:COSAG05_NODE_16701_length_340_cov_1.282158_1_plen_61_part_10